VQSDVRFLTYDEIASAFGINRESARQLVARKRWARRKGNDGKARIEVPSDALEATRTDPDPPHHPADDTGADPLHDPLHPLQNTGVIAVLSRQIERLEADLIASKEELVLVKAERDAECAIAAQVNVLKAQLEAEQRRGAELREERQRELGTVREEARQNAEALKQERDTALSRASDRDALSVQLEALNAVLAVERSRVEEWKAVADRFASQVEKMAAPERQHRSWWPWRRSA
jgi:hypothetical protein